MIKLIKNELFKIFHKKGTYIVLIITILFQILTNYIYNVNVDYNDYDSNIEDIAFLESEIKNIEENGGNLEDLVGYKTDLDFNKMINNYKGENWKQEIISTYYYDIVNNYYRAEIITKDKLAIEKYKNEKDEFIVNLDNNKWQAFAENQIAKNNEVISNLENKLLLTTSNIEKEKINYDIMVAKKEIELENYRLKNKVGYTGFLSQAITDSKNTYPSVLSYENSKNKEDNEYLEEDVKAYYENKYILDNKIDVHNESTLQGVIKNLYDELSFMIFVFIIMIAGSIVSEEFNKGTIKNLLTIPHTRSAILCSKYITVLLMIPFIILFILLLEFIIGGLFFGFSSLNVPVINYVISDGQLSVMNAISYYFLIAITKLPIILLLGTLAFSLSVLIGNTAFSIAITFCGYIGSSIINGLAYSFKINFLNYFVTTNWDFSVHLFGESSIFGLSVIHSIMVCLVYYMIMLITDFIYFKKKNIKNI